MPASFRAHLAQRIAASRDALIETTRRLVAVASPNPPSDTHAVAGVAEALRVPQSDIRLFGKPESFTRRRMGVALATAGDVAEARERAKLAASKVKPVRE